MTNIAQFGYSVIRKSITYGSRTKAAAADDISNDAFSDSLPELGSGAAELVPPIEENGIPKRWTTDSLYEWDSSPKGYSVNATALYRVREQLRSEGINADSRTPTHEITDEQMERLESRYDLKFINACSKEHSEFGNFMLDLAYMNVFSLDEVENFFGVDPLNHTQTVVNLMELCGWTENGIIIAFLQQTLFLALVMIFLHVLLSMQPYWYGWVADVILTAVICVFTPIAPLRHVLSAFFAAVMFNSNSLLHIVICTVLSMLLAAAGLAVLKRKTL